MSDENHQNPEVCYRWYLKNPNIKVLKIDTQVYLGKMTLEVTSSPNLDGDWLSGLSLVKERCVTNVLPLLLQLHLKVVHLPLFGS